MADAATPTDVPQEAPAEVTETEKMEAEVVKTEPETTKPEPETTKPEEKQPESEATKPEEKQPEPETANPEVQQTVPETAKPDPETMPVLTYAQMPKPKYNPRHAHHVRNPKSYASMLIADQEMMLANLRNVRRQLEKEDRQLRIMQQTLYNHDSPRKWTPSHRYLYENDY